MVTHRFKLPQLLKDLNLPLVGAELGIAEGYFSNDLLDGGLETLYMVDAWATLDVRGDGGFPQEWHDANMAKALARVRKHGEKAVILRGLTTQMAELVPDGSLGLVYIDADHSYEGCKRDILAWIPKLAPLGIMAFHDYLAPHYGVNRAVKEYAQLKNYRIYEIPENKPEDAGAMFRVEASGGL